MQSFDERILAKFASCKRGIDDLHDYQVVGSDFMLDKPFSALFIDLGLGKTVISLTTLARLLDRFNFNRALIIAPLRVANQTWPTEMREWRHVSHISFTHIRDDEMLKYVDRETEKFRSQIIASHKSDFRSWQLSKEEMAQELSNIRKSRNFKVACERARIKASQEAVRRHMMRSSATVHIINRENVEFLVNAWGRDWPYDCVIIDESSGFKDHRSRRFKSLAKVRPLIRRLHELTATPAAESYLGLFAQIYLLDRGERFGKSFPAFRSEYFDYDQYSHECKLKPGAEDKILNKIADICMVMKAEDYLDLKEPIRVVQTVKLEKDQRELYETMQKDFVVQLPGGEYIEAENAAQLSQKLLQLASGVLYQTVSDELPNGDFKKRRVVHELHTHKIDELSRLNEEVGDEPLLVVYNYQSSLDRLKKFFPHAVVMDKEGAAVDRWNRGEIKMLLIHPQSAGHGLNLQHGGHQIVFFDIPWSLELYLQVIGRLARQGQTKAVVVHHIVAEATLDELVVEALIRKENVQLMLFQKLKEIRKNLLRQPKVAYNALSCEEAL